jgi:adenosylcobinamide kinase/adenosylcobinamide-phosphate guanylyltransferase
MSLPIPDQHTTRSNGTSSSQDKRSLNLRLGVCGSASVGKTALANALAADFGLPCLREEMRDYLESTGIHLADRPPLEIIATLLQLWQERSEKELQTSAFIADTCPLDFAACALYYGCMDAENASLLLSEKIIASVAAYDAIIILPWGALPYCIDGVRPSNQHQQLRYQLILEGLLRKYVDSRKLYICSESITHLDDRRRWARSIVAKLGKTMSGLQQESATLEGRSVTLVMGGVRSGKSRFAVQQALDADSVGFIATAQASDPEMAAKIKRHQEERPASWTTIEEPLELAYAISQHSGKHSLLVIDCLTLFAANLLESFADDPSVIDKRIEALCSSIQGSKPAIILVTNEVGSGVVPSFAAGRRFRDLLGEINQRVAAVSTAVVLMVAGIPMAVKGEIGVRSAERIAV